MRMTIVCLMGLMLLAGCQQPENPSFSITPQRAASELHAMQAAPLPLKRPVIVVGGYADPGVGPWVVANRLREHASATQVYNLASTFSPDMNACRQRLIDDVDRLCPTDDPTQTAEVDVIGLSMGGLVARYAAAPIEGKRRLRIARLFTVSSPHAGAKLAEISSWDVKVKQMRAGSDFLTELAAHDAGASYELYCYTRLNDDTVGEHLAAPPGRTAWWVSTPPLQSAHVGAGRDPRIEADILRRLRNEPAYATDPPAPLPN